jgi:hypothetical protein
MTLRYPQKLHRRRKKDAEKNFRFYTREDGTQGVRGTKKPLCVRVSQEAYDKLKADSQLKEKTMEQMLSHMIYHSITCNQGSRQMGVQGYYWDSALRKAEEKQPEAIKDKPVRRKAKRGEVMLNLRITYTAWMKLEAEKIRTKKSKARLVDEMVLSYRFVPQHILDRNKAREDELRAKYPKQPIQYGSPHKKKWEKQVEDMTMEEFDAWCEKREAESQAMIDRWNEREKYMEELRKEREKERAEMKPLDGDEEVTDVREWVQRHIYGNE